MPGNKKKTDESSASGERLEDLVHEAMLSLGWVLPATPENVARIEAGLDESAALPAALSDPYAVFDAVKRPCPRPLLRPSNDDVAECLSRVAREGREIPPEVEARMRLDREEAERDADEGS